jgi:hypothetical protein
VNRLAATVAGAAILCFCLAIPCGARPLGVICGQDSVGLDTSRATGSFGAILGEAVGQTFTAMDTLIQSVTVWRIAAQDTDYAPMKLWITQVDSSGTPLTNLVVLDGPSLIIPFGDHVHPTRVEYDFDPPAVLPRPSRYFLAIQNLCAGYFDLLDESRDEYAGGHEWRTYRSNFDGCVLRAGPETFPDYDLIFTIVFCGNSTPIRNPTWGQLKVRYR